MSIKVINAGNCMICGREIKIVTNKDNKKFPDIFFCPACEKRRVKKGLNMSEPIIKVDEKMTNKDVLSNIFPYGIEFNEEWLNSEYNINKLNITFIKRLLNSLYGYKKSESENKDDE